MMAQVRYIKLNQIQTRTNLEPKPQKKVAPNSKFVWHSTEIIRQSKIKGPLMRKIKIKQFIGKGTYLLVSFLYYKEINLKPIS